MKPWIVFALAFVASAAAAQTPSTPPARGEVPIREVVLSDGVRRYAVPVRIGDTDVEAGLDAGSPGLRVLPKVLTARDARTAGGESAVEFANGTTLYGAVGKARVSIGGVAGETTLQLVDRAGCASDRPQCPAQAMSPAQFDIQGDGLPGEGFKALLALAMTTSDLANPLTGMGVRRWIIELPRPGEGRPGRLVLNPTDEELTDYVRVPIMAEFSKSESGLHDAVPGCIMNMVTKDHFCGALYFDLGTPGIWVSSPKAVPPAWADGTGAMLLVQDAAGHVQAAERLIIGLRSHASHLAFTPVPQGEPTVIYTGLTPFFAYSVLYDPEHGMIGLKPRQPVLDGPQALHVSAPAGSAVSP